MKEPEYEKYKVSIAGTSIKAVIYIPSTALDLVKAGLGAGYSTVVRGVDSFEMVPIGKVLVPALRVCIIILFGSF